MSAYTPIVWRADCTLTDDERKVVEAQHRQVWDEGVTREPLATEMALMLAATLLTQGAHKTKGTQ
jgi:hypothetical protein